MQKQMCIEVGEGEHQMPEAEAFEMAAPLLRDLAEGNGWTLGKIEITDETHDGQRSICARADVLGDHNVA